MWLGATILVELTDVWKNCCPPASYINIYPNQSCSRVISRIPNLSIRHQFNHFDYWVICIWSSVEGCFLIHRKCSFWKFLLLRDVFLVWLPIEAISNHNYCQHHHHYYYYYHYYCYLFDSLVRPVCVCPQLLSSSLSSIMQLGRCQKQRKWLLQSWSQQWWFDQKGNNLDNSIRKMTTMIIMIMMVMIKTRMIRTKMVMTMMFITRMIMTMIMMIMRHVG